MKIPENTIINGDIFWDSSVLKSLKAAPAGGDIRELYGDAPGSFYDSLVRSAEKYPDRICITDNAGTSYTYSRLLEMTDDFSRVLFHRYGVRPGMRIGLLLYNCIGFCVSFYAISRLNAASVPLSTKYRKAEVLSLIEKASLSGLIRDEVFAGWFEDGSAAGCGFILELSDSVPGSRLPSGEACPDVPSFRPAPSDTAIIMFTSGTTSCSKGVIMSNYNTMHAVTVYRKIFRITEKDVTVIPVPIYHVTGLIGLLALFIDSGGHVILHKFFDAQRVLSDAVRYSVTFIHAAPTVFSLLLERRAEFPSLPALRLMACGSSNMPGKKILELKEWLPDAEFRTVYGLTETSSPASIFPCDASQSPYMGSSGHPVPGTLFKICSDSGSILPPGRVGSIWIKGSVVTPGYFINAPVPLEDGWLDTGDLGYFNEEGYLYIVDRKKDMINRGGEKVCSIDVENALYNIPGIAEAAVVGIADEKYGEVPAAMITLQPGAELTPEKLHDDLKKVLAGFQIPARFLIADSIPLTANSKVDKKKIRQLLSQNL